MTIPAWARGVAFGLVAALVSGGLASAQLVPPAQPVVPAKPAIKPESATHVQKDAVVVKGEGPTAKLQTLAVDGEGRVLGLVALPRTFGAPTKDAVSEVHVLSPEGKPIKTWKVDFHAHSINVGPDGKVFVAGDGKVARFDKDGKLLGKTELPHIADLLKDNGELRKQAEAQVKLQKDNFERARQNIKDQKAKIEAKKEGERTDQEKRLLSQYELILKNYENSAKVYEAMTPESVMASMTGRLRIINGIAVSKQDVFVACGEAKGYGYAIWRMSHDFKEPKQVLSSLGGCCGQMDVQVSGDDLLVAENTKHQFARYNREGKPIARHGKRGTDSEGDCFGGCCNPMNLRCGSKGDVYTAESEGIIKLYDAEGKFKGLVGVATLQGGCKNVAVGVSPDGSKVYLCDQPGSRVIVLEKKKG